MHTLSIDIETYSSYDLTKTGVYKYVEAPDFEILMVGYSFDRGEVYVDEIDDLPLDFHHALQDKDVLKTAFNANFEMTCLSKFFGITLDPAQWECTMVKAAMLGLPLSLDQVAKVLKITEKDKRGKALINYFSKPCKPTKANGFRSRNVPGDAPEKWKEFMEYCKQDVVVEQEVQRKISFFSIPATERTLWSLDQVINQTGVEVDPIFIANAIKLDTEHTEELVHRAKEITKLDNPNSIQQLIKWINETDPTLEATTLTKESVPVLYKSTNSEEVKEVLRLRQKMAKTSVKKYAAMVHGMCADNRVKGLLQFYGANRTGRWCLAEGTMVLIKHECFSSDCEWNGVIYEMPIELVKPFDRVWDGAEWVWHDGVVFSGDKEVIEHDGVIATPEHIVYISDTQSMTLQEAKNLNLPLWQGNPPR